MEVQGVKFKDTSKFRPKKISADQIKELKAKHPTLSQAQLAKLLNCDHSNLSRRLKHIEIVDTEVKGYIKNEADILAQTRMELLQHLTPEKMAKSSAYQIVGMVCLLIDKDRLIRGLSTDNIIVGTIAVDMLELLNKLKVEDNSDNNPSIDLDNSNVLPPTDVR